MEETKASPSNQLSRRRLLKAGAPVAVSLLAGCEGPCFMVDIEQRLSLIIQEIEIADERFQASILIRSDPNPHNDRSATLKDISLNFLTFDLESYRTLPTGDLDTGEERQVSVPLEQPPIFLTADVGGSSVDSSEGCERVEPREQVLGYVGDPTPNDEINNEEWQSLGFRRPDDTLPLSQRWRDRLQCLHRKHRWNRYTQQPELRLLDVDPEWIETPIKSPQITRVYQTISEPVTREEQARHQRRQNTYTLDDLPQRARELVTTSTREYVTRRRYFELASAFEGRPVWTIPELPGYTEPYIHGISSRQINLDRCTLEGSYNKYVWYFIETPSGLRVVVLNYRENRNPGRRYMQFDPQCEDWGNSREILFYEPENIGLWTAHQSVAIPLTPEPVREYLPESTGQRGAHLEQSEWRQFSQALAGDRPSPPSCNASHVGCERFDNCQGGTGRERWQYFRLMDQSPQWIVALRDRQLTASG